MDTDLFWYAYQSGEDDCDSGTGTTDADEARAWLRDNPEGRIAVFRGDSDVPEREWYGAAYTGHCFA